MNLSTWPPWRLMIGTTASKSSLSFATTSRAPRRRPRTGEVAHVAEQDRDVELSIPSRGKSLAEDVARRPRVEIGAEGLADPLALGQAGDHLVEGGGELAELVGGGDRHRRRSRPAHRLDGALEVADRAQDRLREQHRELERDRDRDADRDQDSTPSPAPPPPSEVAPRRCTR